jgi:hypothetical protein
MQLEASTSDTGSATQHRIPEEPMSNQQREIPLLEGDA